MAYASSSKIYGRRIDPANGQFLDSQSFLIAAVQPYAQYGYGRWNVPFNGQNHLIVWPGFFFEWLAAR